MSEVIALINFLKKNIPLKEIALSKEFFDNSVSLYEESFNLIIAENFSGATGLVLEIAKNLIENHYNVVYFDPLNSITPNRIHDLKDLVICHVTDINQFLGVAREFRKMEKVVYIFDSVESLNNLDLIDGIIEQMRVIHPKSTIIVTRTSIYEKTRVSHRIYSNVIRLRLIKSLYNDDGLLIGHLATVKGKKGESTLMFDYTDGRPSRAYANALHQHKNGTALSGTYINSQNQKFKGFWNYVHNNKNNFT